jgi:hypothetical protein
MFKAVAANKKKETGNNVNDYDEGGSCISKKVILSGSETPEDISIHELEQEFLPTVTGLLE